MVAEVISSIQEMDCRTTAFMLDHQELVERMQEMQSRILFISFLDTDSSGSPIFIILIPLIYLSKTKTSRLLFPCLKKTMFLLPLCLFPLFRSIIVPMLYLFSSIWARQCQQTVN
jgi:hypothetical protein